MELVVPLLRTVVAVAAIVGLLWWAGRRLSGRAPSGAGLAGSGLGGPGLASRPRQAASRGAGLGSVLAAVRARLGERRPAPERALRVVERATLSPRASVALVELGGRRLLLGVGEQGITVLDRSVVPAASASADGDEPDDAPAHDATAEPSCVDLDFEAILQESLATTEGAPGRAENR
ncbi:flagellar biosynthetic protein FliO [Sanguibacter sp. HDW7]|uniref:flagellar biosynthetic protein FliO n=1 Tax=Sanguibacter sp. HDW7 TaxID=2714931 RepID=UPI00140B407A|nr:flagellar biosynthetic protein FliO [Sanguibacter sp. HDW7]QIK84295.1 flagellar biosynthetic protein FliO [Sanguibacter sp. HDW7]